MLLTKRDGDWIGCIDVPNDSIAWKKLLDTRSWTGLNRAVLRGTGERWSNRVSGLVTLVMRLCLQCGNTMRQEMLRAAPTSAENWRRNCVTEVVGRISLQALDDEYCNNSGFITAPRLRGNYVASTVVVGDKGCALMLYWYWYIEVKKFGLIF